MTSIYAGAVDLQPFNKSPGTGVVANGIVTPRVDVLRIMEHIDRSLPEDLRTRAAALRAGDGVVPGDGRTASWVMSTSPTTPWVPAGSGETAPSRYLQGDVGKRYALAMRRVFEKAPGFLVRSGNFHGIPGYAGWASEYAHSATAIDWMVGTDGHGNKHTVPFLQFSVEGGGIYDPLIDWFKDTIKNWFVWEVTDLSKPLDIAIELQPASTAKDGWIEAWVNGQVWIEGQNIPTCYPGVTVKSQHDEKLDYAQTLGQTGYGLWDGGYEAAGIVDNETAEHFGLTMTQIGESPEECIADKPYQVGSWSTVAARAGAIASSITRVADFDTAAFVYPAAWKTSPIPTYVVTDTLPSAGAVVKGTITWQATPNNAKSTAKVEFFVDGVLQMGRAETTTPYGCTNIAGANSDDGQFDTTKLADATHIFETRATASDGSVASKKTALTILNHVAPPPPVIDVPGALADIKAGLQDDVDALAALRASNGYKSAKHDNPNPVSFAATKVGITEAKLVAAIAIAQEAITRLGG